MATVGSSKRHLNITSDSSAAASTMTLGGNGVATEAYVGTQITNLIDSSPSALNTLNELAAALGDDASFSTTVTNSIATKLPLAAGSGNKLTDALYIQGTNTTSQESVLIRGISSNDGDWLGSIRTANTGGYNQEMRFYTSNANGTSDEDLTLTLHPTQNATFASNIYAGGDLTVAGGDVTVSKQNDAPTLTLLHDGTNPSTNDLLFKMQFQSDYDGTHQNWGKIICDTNNSAVRTNLDFFVKSASGGEQIGFRIEGQPSETPKAYFYNDVDVAGALTSTNITIADGIYHEGDGNTFLNFGTDAINLNTGGGSRINITNSITKVNNDLIVVGSETFSLGERAEGDDNGRTVLIEGAASGDAGEGSGRIFFSEHNSTDTSADKYGLSLYYEGNPNAQLPSGFQPNTGNGTWSLRRHDNSLSGAAIMSGGRTNSNVTFAGTIGATNFSGSSSGTNTGDQDLSGYSTASGVEDNADVTDTANVVAALTAGTNVQIAANGTISATDSDTNYYLNGLTYTPSNSTLTASVNGATNQTLDLTNLGGYDKQWGNGSNKDFNSSDLMPDNYGSSWWEVHNISTSWANSPFTNTYQTGLNSPYTYGAVHSVRTGNMKIQYYYPHTGSHEDHIWFRTSWEGDLNSWDYAWERIFTTADNIHTQHYVRADGGFFVDGTTKGINGSGNFIGGTITGASDANVANWNTAYGWGDHASGGYSTATGVANNADVTPSWLPANDPSYLTSLPSHNHNNLYYTEDEIRLALARINGWEAGYGSGTASNIKWNLSEEALELKHDTDTSIGAVYKAVYMEAGETKRFSVMIRGSSPSDNGMYIRLYQHDGDLPNGKTHVSNDAQGTFVQEDDRGDSGWYENGAVSDSWTNFEREYKAPASGYVSIVVLNWTGVGLESLFIKTPDIQTVYATVEAGSIGISELDVSDGSDGQVLTTNGSGTLSFATVSSGGADTNYYLDGIARTDSTNTLVFSVNGATNQSYTFGANAFNSTTIPAAEAYTAHEDTSNLSGVYGDAANGTKIDTITVDANGHVTAVATGATGNMTGFFVEDGDGTEVQINNANEWKFVEGTGININWSDTSHGSDADPYDLTFSIKDNSVNALQLNVSGDGTAGQVLASDGDGTFSWVADANTDTVYTHPTGDGNNHIPTGGAAGQFLKYSASGTATWATPSYTTNTDNQLSQADVIGMLTAGTNITISEDGTIDATDSDTVYTHPTTAGNKHIPAGGAAGQFLKYSSDGTATWATPSYTTNTNTTYSAGTGLDLTSTTFSVEPDLRDGITHVGKDTNNYIQFDSTNGRIDFYAGGVFVARMESDGDLHIKGDVIAFSDIFS